MLTRTDMQLLALRAMFDLPFYLLIFGAARARAAPPALRLAGARAALPRRAAAAGGVAALRRLLALARAGHAAPAADPLRAARRRRAAALDAARPDRDRRAAVLAHVDARGVGPVRAQPRAVRRDHAASRSTRAATTASSRSASAGSGCCSPCYILRRRAALPLALGGLGVADVPDHRRGRAVGDPALPDDPVAAALALRRGRARRLDAGRGARARRVAIGDRGRLGARARLARAVLLRRLRQARRPGGVHRGPARGPDRDPRRAARRRRRCSRAGRSPCRPTPRSR